MSRSSLILIIVLVVIVAAVVILANLDISVPPTHIEKAVSADANAH